MFHITQADGYKTTLGWYDAETADEAVKMFEQDYGLDEGEYTNIEVREAA